jgi:hypothetical protein
LTGSVLLDPAAPRRASGRARAQREVEHVSADHTRSPRAEPNG